MDARPEPAAPWPARLLREPLVHFLAIGLALFAVYRARHAAPEPQEAKRRIVLTQGDLDQITAQWRAQGRPAPSAEQMRTLVEERIREEVLCREALELGLDRDDAIVKHRMVEKMQFLAEDVGSLREPSREKLEAFLRDHADRFALPPLASFRHLYFSFDNHGEKTEAAAREALRRVAGKPADTEDAAALADPFMFQDAYADRSPDRVAAEFGGKFAKALFGLEPGAWRGPVESGYGWHVVFVSSLAPGRAPALEEVEQDVKNQWTADQRAEANRKAYETMRARYEIVLPPAPEAPGLGSSERPKASPSPK